MASDLKELAVNLLSCLEQESRRYAKCNELLREIEADFPVAVFPINGFLSTRCADLIDAILGDSIGSYYLFECCNMRDGGAIHDRDGATWPIRSIDDVRAYVNRAVEPKQEG